MMAKLASGKNKPNKQTVVMPVAAAVLLKEIPIQKIPKFGQKFNKIKETSVFLNKSIGDIFQSFSEEDLQEKLGKDLGTWIFKASQGIDDTPVKSKGPPKSIMTSMSLTVISNNELQLRNVLYYISTELVERLVEDFKNFNGRQPKTIVFGYRLVDQKETSQSIALTKFKGLNVHSEKVDSAGEVEPAKIIANTCLNTFLESVGETRWKVRWIGLTATNFNEILKSSNVQITSFFQKATSPVKPAETFFQKATSPVKTAETSPHKNNVTTTPEKKTTPPAKAKDSSPKKRKTEPPKGNTSLLNYFQKQ